MTRGPMRFTTHHPWVGIELSQIGDDEAALASNCEAGDISEHRSEGEGR
jgi:hypothetical protein